MKRLRFAASLCCALLLAIVLSGAASHSPLRTEDSPLTSTPFWQAYPDVEMVQYARDTRVMSEKVCRFLCDDRQPTEYKAAVINALGWEYSGKRDASVYRAWLEDKYKRKGVSFDNEAITAQEWMCLGYSMAMSDYTQPEEAIPYLEQAHRKAPEDYTVHLMLALVRAQQDLDEDWCQVWKGMSQAVNSRAKKKRNMRKGAVEIIMNYIGLYQSDCP